MHKSLVYAASIGVAGTLVFIAARPATGKTTMVDFVELQPAFPGTVQTGHINVSGVINGTSIRGNGSALTNLGANNITTGLLDPARLGATVAKTNTLNTFSAVQRFASNVLMTSQLNTIMFPAVSATNRPPMLTMFSSGTGNSDRMVIGHSPSYPTWGLEYSDSPDIFYFRNDARRVMAVDLDQGRVGIGTQTPTSPLNVITDGTSNTIGIGEVQNGDSVLTLNAGYYGLVCRAGGSGFSAGLVGLAKATGNLSYGTYGYAGGNSTNYGIYGTASGGTTNYSGYFDGLLWASSSSAGVKSFLIDHPLDPENKLLEHSSVESDQRMNLYRGVVTTDARGYATVAVPRWFSALNKNIQYQLTVVDDGSDSGEWVLTRVARELRDGEFVLRTSRGNVKVNWMVSGERHDPTSEYYPLQVERDKPDGMKGKYMVPQAYGYGEERAMNPGPARERNEKAPSQR